MPSEEFLDDHANVEKLGVRKGDILCGPPSTTGCPVTHVGLVVEEPDYPGQNHKSAGAIIFCRADA